MLSDSNVIVALHTHSLFFSSTDGGPGASSTVGLWTELGPVLLNDDAKTTDASDGTTTISPQYNPYAWTRLGHLLMIDQPAPVGFSYCNDDVVSENCGNIAWTDELTTDNTMMAFATLFDQFPDLLDLPLYLTGESYAGIYIPTLARSMMSVYDNLVGFAVGDGCLGTETGICSNIGQETVPTYWDLLFLLGHHQIPIDTYHYVMSECRTDTTTGKAAAAAAVQAVVDIPVTSSSSITFVNTKECQEAWKKVQDQVGGMYAYGLYDECTYENGLSKLKGGLNDYTCGGVNVMVEYFNMPDVQAAFHVEANFFQTDNAEGGFRYTATEPDLRPFYQHVVAHSSLRVLVYNGDADPSINSFMTRDWTSHLPGLVETQAWRPWTVDGCRRMGGYVTRYEGDFDFLTIRGAGHMCVHDRLFFVLFIVGCGLLMLMLML
jgi:serine carboxypeptidase-like clade I